MENDKRYTSVGDENKEQVTKRLRQQIEECLENDKPIIVGLENDLYTLGRTQSPEKLIKFVMKATKGLAEMIEKATGFLTAKDFLEITISVMVEAEEGKASEQKNRCPRTKTAPLSPLLKTKFAAAARSDVRAGNWTVQQLRWTAA